VVAVGIGNQIRKLLIGRSADPEVEARMREFLQRCEEIDRLYGMITLQLGTSLMVAVKARMKARDVTELIDGINRCEAAMRAEFQEIQWLFFEPDVRD